ncbi:MAG TPA: DNA repair protein RecN [Propionibacteriaceae bacterium]|nr:DNA repair protein RecN [Propionibacteriaceae bacterium]
MIDELRIADLGVINEATISLHPGLTAVTGETGAGKTMIITGLGLLLGGRSDPRAVRNGADRARVEGRFRVADPAVLQRVTDAGGVLDDDELLIARHVTTGGRSRAYLGGTQVPAAMCAGVAEALVTVHGQSEQLRLADPDRQRALLDRYAGCAVSEPLDRYRSRYAERRELDAQLQHLRAEAQSRAREIDLLRYGLDEIERVAPLPGEDSDLSAEATRLQSVDDLRRPATQAMIALTGDDDHEASAVSSLAVARKAMEQIAGHDDAVVSLAARVADASYLAEDLAADLARYLGTLEVQPGRLEAIAQRRSELAGLTRKYGDTVDEVIAWAAEAVTRLAELETSDDTIRALTERVHQLDSDIDELAARISRARADAAAGLAPAVLEELAALAMPHARLQFVLTPIHPGPWGADQVELLFSANRGSEVRSLAKVASGGELSRVRLALEVVLAAGDQAGTFVFDEVDAGVGGRVAVEIGRRLASLAQHTQVIVVTHLAQVAAFADRHYVVVKSSDGQVTTSGVVQVNDDGRAAELARMMAGLETTDSALAHARELVAMADSVRRPAEAEGPRA